MPAFSGTPTITGGNAGIGDTITVNFTLNEAQISTSKPIVRLRAAVGGTITVPDAGVTPVGVGRTAWRAVYTVTASGSSVPAYSGTINRLDVTATDAAGNRNPSPINRTLSGVTIDNTAPAFSGTPTITGGNAGIGDSITVNFTLNEAQISTSNPTVRLRTTGGDTITVPPANVSAVTGRTAWRAVYTVTASGSSVPAYSGTVNRLDVTATDAAGNSSTVNRPLSGGTIDNTRPDLSGTPTISSNNSVSTTTKAGIGNTITVNFTLSEAQKTGVDPTVKLRFGTSGPITVPSADVSAVTGRTAWQATYLVPSTPAYSGAVTLNVEAEDAAGNTTPTPLSHSFSTFTIDNTAPSAPTSLGIQSSPAGADDTKIVAGERAEVTFTASDTSGINTSLTQVVFTVGGNTLNGTVTRIGAAGNNYRARTRALTASDLTFQGTMTATVRVFDNVGNSSALTTVTGFVTVDTVAPTLSSSPAPAIKSSPAGADDTKIVAGERAEVTFTAADTSGISTSSTQVVFTVGGNTLNGTVTRIGAAGNNYRARTRALTASDLTFQGTMTATVRVFDNAGNSSALTTVTGSVTVDTVAPAFSAGPTFDPVQPTLGYTASQSITIEVTGVSSDATSVQFTFNGTTYSASKVGTTATWRTASVAVPGSTGDYSVDVKVVDGHGNETTTTGAASIKVQ